MDELRVLIADDHDLIRRGVRDLLAARSGWKVVGEAFHARFRCRLDLRTDIDGACRIFSDKDGGKSWSAARMGLEIGDDGGDALANSRSGGFPVNPPRGHTV